MSIFRSLFYNIRSGQQRPTSLAGSENIPGQRVTTLPREAPGPRPVVAAAPRRRVSARVDAQFPNASLFLPPRPREGRR